jgi:hypothetical protein
VTRHLAHRFFSSRSRLRLVILVKEPRDIRARVTDAGSVTELYHCFSKNNGQKNQRIYVTLARHARGRMETELPKCKKALAEAAAASGAASGEPAAKRVKTA